MTDPSIIRFREREQRESGTALAPGCRAGPTDPVFRFPFYGLVLFPPPTHFLAFR